MKVALVQMTTYPEIDCNIKNILTSISAASKRKADMVFFPENCACLGPGKIMKKFANFEREHPALKAATVAAKNNNIYVLLGSIAVFPDKGDQTKMQNRSILINSNGCVIARYNKINMFDVEISKNEFYRESDRYIPGKTTTIVKTEFGKIGLSICYDLRFSNLYKKLSEKGANIITVPSAFTKTTGRAHWEVMLRARAIENSVWIIAPAQVGHHYGNRYTWGHSMVVNPWGKIIQQSKRLKEIIYADIDVNLSSKTKKVFSI